MAAFMTDVRPLHANARCVAIDVFDVRSGQVVLSDVADAERADERAVLMLDCVCVRAGGEA